MKKLLFILLILPFCAWNSIAKAVDDTTWVESKIILETKTGKLYGTLCTPKNFVKGPVALIIAGSGPTDRDCNSPMMKTDAYKKLAHHLADNNIATVRYDKRGIAESKASMTKETVLHFEDLVNDADGWLQMLKSDKRFSKVIVIGHSEGSLIGMLIAKNGADKYISVAGVSESADKVLKTQLAAQSQAMQDSLFPIIDSLAAGKLVKNINPNFNALFRPSVQPYLISWFKYDPAAEIKKLTLPILILQGTKDLQVTINDAKMLGTANPRAKVILLDSMNHVFRIITGERVQNLGSYSDPTLPVDPELVTDITEFINKN
jgi:uncharacterized protein